MTNFNYELFEVSKMTNFNYHHKNHPATNVYVFFKIGGFFGVNVYVYIPMVLFYG